MLSISSGVPESDSIYSNLLTVSTLLHWNRVDRQGQLVHVVGEVCLVVPTQVHSVPLSGLRPLYPPLSRFGLSANQQEAALVPSLDARLDQLVIEDASALRRTRGRLGLLSGRVY